MPMTRGPPPDLGGTDGQRVGAMRKKEPRSRLDAVEPAGTIPQAIAPRPHRALMPLVFYASVNSSVSHYF